MRRFRQQLSEESAREILSKCSNGVLSLVGEDGAPYGVPLSFAYDGEAAVYFHCALDGRKLDCIRHDRRCSFCVVGQDLIAPEEFTTHFRSVIVEGTVRIVEDSDEIMKGLMLLCDKYLPGVDPSAELSKYLSRVAVLRLDIQTLTGKEAIELVRKRIGE